ALTRAWRVPPGGASSPPSCRVEPGTGGRPAWGDNPPTGACDLPGRRSGRRPAAPATPTRGPAAPSPGGGHRRLARPGNTAGGPLLRPRRQSTTDGAPTP